MNYPGYIAGSDLYMALTYPWPAFSGLLALLDLKVRMILNLHKKQFALDFVCLFIALFFFRQGNFAEVKGKN